jgi:putative spermidine/putrescine transport system permease protein
LKNKLKPYVLLLPAGLILLGVFVCGIGTAVLQSLGYFPTIGMRELTLNYYREILTDREFLSSFWFSLCISLCSSIIAVILGVLFAYLLFQNKNKKGIEKFIYRVPIVVPHVVAALLVYNVLSQSGIMPRVLYGLGIIQNQNEFPLLLFDKYGIGVIIAYLWKEIPFVAMVVYTVLGNLNDKLSEVSLNLGANKRQTFYHVLLPLLMPSILSSFIIIFAFSFGAFEVPYLLGPTSPRALPVLAYIEYTSPDLTSRPYAMALNSLITVFSVVLVWLYGRAFKLINRYNR